MAEASEINRIWQLLTPRQRRASATLLALLFAGMLLETLGVGLVVPVLTIMLQDGVIERYPVLGDIMRILGAETQAEFVLRGMFVLVGVYFIKVVYLGFLARRQFTYLADVQVTLSQRLFTRYLRQPYAFHLQRNSSQLLANVVTEVSMLNAGLTSALALVAEVLVVVGITALLLIVEPVGALIAFGVIGVTGGLFHRLTHRRVAKWGEARQRHERLRYQHVLQGLGGVKEVLLFGRESDFLAQHEEHNAARARIEARQLTLQAMPRLFLELLVVAALSVVVLTSAARGQDIRSLIPVLGLFAAAAFRVMPSANRILSSLQSLRYVAPGVSVVHDELRLMASHPSRQDWTPILLSKALTIEDVSFRYDGAAENALSHIDVRIERGSSVGIIGASGAGKSTLIDVLLGLLKPTAGSVRADGVDVQCNLRGWQDHIGYVPQSIFLTDDTLRRNIAFGLPEDQIDDAAVLRAISAAQLTDYVHSLPLGLNTVVGERGVRLSGGQRQRIGIARALYHDPSVLVLDEATSALDTATEREVMATVRALRGEKTLIIVAHRISTVANCDRIFRLHKGRLVEEGDPAIVLQKVARPSA